MAFLIFFPIEANLHQAKALEVCQLIKSSSAPLYRSGHCQPKNPGSIVNMLRMHEHDIRTKVLTNEDGRRLLQMAKTVGDKASVFAMAAFWDPAYQRYRVAARLPDGEPDLNKMVRETLSKQRAGQLRKKRKLAQTVDASKEATQSHFLAGGQEGAGGSAEIQRMETNDAARQAELLKRPVGFTQTEGEPSLFNTPSSGGSTNPSSGNAIVAATAVQADAATMSDEAPHQGETHRAGPGNRTPTPTRTAAVASNQSIVDQEPSEQSAATCLAFDKVARSRLAKKPPSQASHDILNSIETVRPAEKLGGRASDEGNETSIEARILAVACISLAYMRQLEEGGAAQADEVRDCLLRTLLLDPETPQLWRSSSRVSDSTSAPWLDVVMGK